MHGSIWHLAGDADALLPRYDALLADIGTENMSMHLCLRAPDGLVIVDTCPSQEAFASFVTGEQFRDALQRHGLPFPDRLDDFPVHIAVSDGRVLAEA